MMRVHSSVWVFCKDEGTVTWNSVMSCSVFRRARLWIAVVAAGM